MATKIIEHTETKATQISTFTLNDVQYINIRGMYKKRNAKKSDDWQYGAKAVSLPVEEGHAEEVLRKALKMVKSDETKYPELKTG